MKLPFLKTRQSNKSRVTGFKRPSKQSNSLPKRSGVYGMKSHSTSKRKSQTSRAFRATFPNALKVLVLGALFIVASALVLYFGVNMVLRLREDTNKQQVFEAGQVAGFEQIPVFPGSENVFQNVQSDDVVKKFIGEGYSVYRLPVNKDINSAYEYYLAQLTDLGWKNVLKVEVGSVDKRPGQYWTKDGNGLRIFTKIDDIWYQRLSESDAKEGLASDVLAENNKKLILAQANSTSLLPDYPWKLSVPSQYTVKYFTSKLNNLQGIEFTSTPDTGKVVLTPYSVYSGLTYDAYIDQYTKENNLRIINSVVTQIKGVTATQASVTDGVNNGSILAINNLKNNVVYIIFADKESNPFVEYLKTNLEIVNYTNLAY